MFSSKLESGRRKAEAALSIFQSAYDGLLKARNTFSKGLDQSIDRQRDLQAELTDEAITQSEYEAELGKLDQQISNVAKFLP